MKLRIQNTPDGMKLSKCFPNAKVTFNHEANNNNLPGELLNREAECFQLCVEGVGLWGVTEITIDTSESQPCIYMCMKHGLKVEVDCGAEFGIHAFNLSEKLSRNNFEYMSDKIKSIKILGIEDMEGLKVVE